MTTQEIKILTEVYEMMPNEFDSYTFNHECKKLGLPKMYSKKGYIAKWLSDKTKKLGRYEYIKNNSNNQFFHLNEIDSAIKLLKSNGYKVLKPITQFKEI